ncbi:hypothetical protein C8F04DRAFT_1228661 [Mycena alexandri]|uniref:Uncharacterized protein n=1 Tax=Mycena alexandri TaxID=1745969 RepID=A0AAD6XDG1_9AGAR|nr:hypothetical protein C8F04DRAFT_1228661 [Mycena alexandri]
MQEKELLNVAFLGNEQDVIWLTREILNYCGAIPLSAFDGVDSDGPDITKIHQFETERKKYAITEHTSDAVVILIHPSSMPTQEPPLQCIHVKLTSADDASESREGQTIVVNRKDTNLGLRSIYLHLDSVPL